jgi:hypothetical protein
VSLFARLMHRTVPGLIKGACLLALFALGLICCSVLIPKPLPIILAMSVGHVIGGAALACYLLAVLVDALRRPAIPDPNREDSKKASSP